VFFEHQKLKLCLNRISCL